MVCFLIDDDIDDREIFSLALEDACEHSECVSASDGIDALEQLNADTTFIPDYIFIDLNMPLMSGKECLKEIRKIQRLRSVPIIIYTTSSYEKDIQETKALGASHYLVKPTSISSFTTTLQQLFEDREVKFKLN